jgi:Flp pilus assembly CpaF family ATPase
VSFDVILSFLRPIAHLIQDPEVSEIMVNGSGVIFIERDGQLEEVTDVRLDARNLIVAVKKIARALGDDVSEERPILDSRLPDGSRVAAILPSCSVGGTTLTIRKFQTRFFTADELVRIGTMPQDVLDQVRTAIEHHRNILISGGTSTAKATTLLNALTAFLPEHHRVVVIEDTAELQLRQRNRVSLEARREQGDLRAVTIRDLLRATLRLRPDRIVVGEVRGGEAFDLLQALNTGHAGSLSTIHANSAVEALARLPSCVVQSGVELPYQAVRYQIADAIDFVLHVGRRDGAPMVEQLLTPGRYDPFAMLMTMSCSSIAPAPDRTPPKCPRAIRTMAWIVFCLPSAARPMSRRRSDEEAIVSTPSMNTAARRTFALPHVWKRIESAPAPDATPVHLVARAGENRTRDDGPRRLGGASHRLGVWTHHPPQGAAGNPRVLRDNPCPLSGLRPSGFPGAHKDSLR